MKTPILKTLFVLLIACTSLLTPLHATETSHNPIHTLVEAVNSPLPHHRHTALLLLAHTALDETAYTTLATKLSATCDSDITGLFIAYTLAVRTQETGFINTFVKRYPVGKQQIALWQIMDTQIDYIAVSLPLQDYLAALAEENDTALLKLASGLPHADGRYAATLHTQLKSLYQHNAQRVKDALQQHNIPISDLIGEE